MEEEQVSEIGPWNRNSSQGSGDGTETFLRGRVMEQEQFSEVG